jgi:hypothetical protein
MCPKCPAVKSFLSSQSKVSGEMFNAHTEEGLAEARKHVVAAVPTIIFFDDFGNELQRAGSIDEITSFLDKI